MHYELMVLDTCGVLLGPGKTPWNFYTKSIAPQANQAGIAAFASDVTWAPGEYRLCWFGAPHFNASVDGRDFNFDAGSLYLIGPDPLTQSHTCVAGQTCTLTSLSGFAPGETWQVMALDTCGPRLDPNVTGHSTFGFPNAGLAWTFAAEINGTRTINGTRENSSEGDARVSGLTITWGDVPISPAGGLYRLCWCGSLSQLANDSVKGSCSTADGFRLDIGSLFVQGPSWQDFATCVSGRHCSLQDFSDLGDVGHLLVLETCGVQSALVPGFPDFTAENSSWPVPISALGGQYRLCWCQGRSLNHTNISYHSDFQRCTMEEYVDMGAFHLVGPSSLEKTCISGLSCSFDGFGEGHSIMLLDTCGMSGMTAPVVHHQQAPWSGEVSFQLTISGGLYRLCWCYENENINTNRSFCDLAEHHLVDAGSLLVLGPQQNQDRTCISGRSCRTQGIWSTGSHWKDQIRILDTCGSNAIPKHFPSEGFSGHSSLSSNATSPGRLEQSLDFGSTAVTTHGGIYRLCWCSGLSESGCIAQMDIGTMTILGPFQEDRTCISGKTCSFDIGGLGFSADDRFLVLDTCGLPDKGISSSTKSQAVAWNEITLMTVSGGEYRLCWCSGVRVDFELNTSNTSHETRNESLPLCTVAWDFRLDVGRLLLHGMSPLEQHATCVAGQPCAIDVAGYVTEGDFVMALDTCGEASDGLGPSRLQLWNQTNDAMDFSQNDSHEVTEAQMHFKRFWLGENTGSASVGSFSGFLTQPRLAVRHPTSKARRAGSVDFGRGQGGKYRLCWCGGLETGASSTRCSGALDFQMDFGELTVIGPKGEMQTQTCITAQECLITLQLVSGYSAFSLSNQLIEGEETVLVLETCSDSGFLGYPTGVGGFNMSGTPAVGVAGGVYRLCWCRGFACTTPEFRVDLGTLQILGPVPLSQHRTCVSGRRCILDGLSVTGGHDKLLILETCGLPALIPLPQSLTSPSEMSGAVVDLSQQMSYSPGGQYRLCWCGDFEDVQSLNLSSRNSSCTHFHEFNLDMGGLMVLGPAPLQQDRTCIAGERCQLEGFLGTGLDQGALLLLETCGFSQASAFNLNLGRPGQPQGSTLGEASASGSTFSWEVAAPSGGSFRLCWCANLQNYSAGNLTHTPPHSGCVVPEEFQLDIGRLDVVGPVAGLIEQRFTCLLGRACRLSGLDSLGFLEGDRLLVLDTCGAQPTRNYLDGVVSDVSGTQSTVRWQSPVLTSISGGQYRLCWCGRTSWSSGSNQTTTPSDCRVDAGELSISGPAPLYQHRTCISGEVCSFNGIIGQGHLSNEDSFLVLDTCGSEAAIARLSSSVKVFKGAAQWNSPITSAGGLYRLCWCSAEENVTCDLPSDFLEIGDFYILGPSPLQQDRTCVAGQSCVTAGLTGHISINDRYLVLDTCGTSLAAVGNAPGYGGHALDSSNESLLGKIYWSQSETSPATGGEYRLCWCAGGGAYGSRCSVAEDFKADDTLFLRDSCQQSTATGLPSSGVPPISSNSSASVLFSSVPTTAQGGTYKMCWCPGPVTASLHQSTECVTAGVGVVELGSLLMIGPQLERKTCYSGHSCKISVSGIHLSSQNQILVQETCGREGINRWPGEMLSLNQSDQRMPLTWSVPITGAGGRYRLCWCFDSCEVSSSFWMDFGTMHMVGPHPLNQDRTCVMGQFCHIESIIGVEASGGSVLAVWDTCGEDTGHLIWHFGNLSNQSSTELARLTYGGGSYRLCWCSGSSSTGESPINAACSVGSDFRTDVGSMLILGVAVPQDRTCVMGLSCSFDVEGYWLASGDEILVLETCGVGLPFLTSTLIADHTGHNGTASNETGSGAALSSARVVPQTIWTGGSYRLCWCGSDRSCAVSDFTDFGRLLVIGPSPLPQARTCVAGQTCVFDGLRGQFYGLAEASLAVLDTCGVAQSKVSMPNVVELELDRFQLAHFEAAPVPGGHYMLCWCPKSAVNLANTSSNLDCLLEEHVASIGSLEIVGPSPLGKLSTCIAGETCLITGLTGAGHYHLAEGDQLLIMETCLTQPAAEGEPLPIALTEAVLGQVTSILSSGVIFQFPNLPSAPGGTYRLCWCAAGFHCSSAEHFRVDAGQLTMVGPESLQQHRSCISGQSCEVDGIQLFPSSADESLVSSAFLVLETCGTFSTIAGVMSEGSTASNASGIFSLGMITSAGGSYRLCWCGNLCRKASDFRVDAGTMSILGPQPLQQQQTCVSGRTCQLQAVAAHAAGDTLSGWLRVLDTCGTVGLAGADVVMSDLTAMALTAAGGSYRVCWCPVIFSNSCTEPQDFAVDIGQLLLIGPAPLTQARTCISGLACHFYDTEGEALSEQDRILLLDTCGSPSALAETGAFLSAFPADNISNTTALGVSNRAPLTVVTGLGGEYRLCWCGTLTGFTCSLPDDFKVDFGSLHFVAPSTFGRTCFSGQHCFPEGIFEEALGGASGSVMALETCGLSTPLQGFGQVWSATVATAANGRITAAGGIYRLCWCAGQTEDSDLTATASNGSAMDSLQLSCIMPEQFLTDLGFLLVVGPAPLAQDRTCMAGQSCVIDGFQGFLSPDATDLIAVLDTCSTPNGFGLFDRRTRPDELVNASNLSETRSVGAGGTRWSFVENRSARGASWLEAGGSYRLCWCGSSCQEYGDFHTDLGRLWVVGPSPLVQMHTCVSGRACVLDSITGVGLASNFQIYKFRLSQDGDPGGTHDIRLFELYHGGSSDGPWTKALQGAALAGTREWQEFFGFSSSDHFWRLLIRQTYDQEPRPREVQFLTRDDVLVSTRQSVLRASGEALELSGVTYSAEKLVDGKLEDDSRWISSGLPTDYNNWEIIFEVRASDSILLMHTCGTALVDRVSGLEEISLSGAKVTWPIPFSTQGGQYKLCWCSKLELCVSPLDFQLDFGTLTIAGPFFNEVTCISGQHCAFSFYGQDLTDGDQLQILNTCGAVTSGALESLSNIFGTLEVAKSLATFPLPIIGTGLYQLCWCRPSALSGCVSPDDFITNAGELHLLGPFSEHHTCVSGRACQQVLMGSGISSEDQILLLETCGSLLSDFTLRLQVGDGNSTRNETNGEATASNLVAFGWEENQMVSGGNYRLCWCSRHFSCLEPEDFRADFGQLLVIGPKATHRYTCISGLPCQVDGLTGEALGANQHLAILNTCGSVEDAAYLRVMTASDGTLGTSFTGATSLLSGGTYRLCWCSERVSGTEQAMHALSNLSNSSLGSCSRSIDFRSDAGALFLLGPAPITQHFTCLSGERCSLGLKGHGFSEQDRLQVMETCGSAAVPKSSSFISVVQAGAMADFSTEIQISAAGGEYRLCWCPGFNMSGYNVSINEGDACFNAGTFQIMGPSPLEQHRTCVSGHSCRISISGYGDLSSSGSFLIQDTCGIDQVVPRFSHAGLMESIEASLGVSTFTAFVNWATATAAGGTYRLCWAPYPHSPASSELLHLMSNSSNTSEFDASLFQGFVEGNASNLTRLLITGFNSSDSLMILETCGGIHLLEAVVLAGGATVARSIHSRTCISGQICSVVGLPGLTTDSEQMQNSSILILDTCALPSHVQGWPQAGQSLTLQLPNSNESARVFPISWGETPVRARGGIYRLCWCATTPCFTYEDDFSEDLGTLTLIGPSTSDYSSTCVIGRPCESMLQGVHLSQNDTVWALETCGLLGLSGALVFSVQRQWPAMEPIGGAELGGGERVNTLLLENSLPMAGGGRYRLCWCGSHQCSSVEDLQVDAGELVLQGPWSSSQDRTCISGRTCWVEGLLGEALLDSDSYLIQDTCGSSQILESMANAGQDVSVVSSGAVVKWGSVSHTFAGGSYKLCWCSDRDRFAVNTSESDCRGRAEMHLWTVGNLFLRGPSPLLQDQTCISDQLCKIDMTGFLDWSDDAVMVLDTCAHPSIHGKFASLSMGTNGRLTIDAHVLAGGTYRLCWCGKDGPAWPNATESHSNRTDCTLATDFQTDFGALHMLGPVTTGAFTCVTGRACRIWHLSGYTEGHFSILDTCGEAMRTPSRFSPVGNGTNMSSPPFLVEAVPRLGGQYRLCWCGRASCEDISAAGGGSTDTGAVFVLGPLLEQDRTCISGRSCFIDGILGLGLTSGDKALILDTCGVSLYVPGLHDAGIATGMSNRSSFAWPSVSANGGEYRLCWCADRSTEGLSLPILQSGLVPLGCLTPADFDVDFGKLHLIGPQASQAFTCVSGQTCVLKGVSYAAGYTEYTEMSRDSLLVLDSCGHSPSTKQLPPIPAFEVEPFAFSWGNLPLTMPGGDFRLCWCSSRSSGEYESNATGEYESFCQRADQFVVDLGHLHIVGPDLKHVRTCVVGWPCHLTGFHGRDLQLGDRYLILDTCGLASHVPQSPAAFLQSASGTWGTEVSWDTAVSSSGGIYRICWCAQGFSCSTFEDFRVDTGELLLEGVLPEQTFTCFRGKPCKVSHVQGVHIESQKAEFLIMDTYFRVDVGTLYLVGPATGHDYTCISGRTCSIDSVIGLGLNNNDAYLVQDTCGVAAAVSGFSSGGHASSITASGTAVSWGSIAVTAAGGQYRLCWCTEVTTPGNTSAHFGYSSCVSPTSFLADVGVLQVIGVDVQQTRTCVTGRSCLIDGITGFGLTNGDMLLILDTCTDHSLNETFVSHTGLRSWQDGLGTQALAASMGYAWYWDANQVPIWGGEYRLCWCSRLTANGTMDIDSNNSCSVSTDFAVDVGELLVLGPTPLQSFTCISGRECKIASRIYGDSDSFMILDTCGAGGQLAVDSRLGVSGDSARLRLPGGNYRLCWCPTSFSDFTNQTGNISKFRCESFLDFFDVGHLEMIGVAGTQDRTCMSGQACEVDLLGLHLSEWDLWQVFDTCGVSGTPGFPPAPSVHLSAHQDGGLWSTARVSWNSITSPGGVYRLCWCSRGNWTDSASTCRDSFVDVGQLDVLGPGIRWTLVQRGHCGSRPDYPEPIVLETNWTSQESCHARCEQLRNECLVGWYADRGPSQGECQIMETCALIASDSEDTLLLFPPQPAFQTRTCVSGQVCTIGNLLGNGLTEDDSYMILDTCGLQNALAGWSSHLPTSSTPRALDIGKLEAVRLVESTAFVGVPVLRAAASPNHFEQMQEA
ncbi:Alpha-agarase [Durusdinium trenchii]|uniref:Alpha-agarase n=1 Tax=Durusdinium trenchii TaxID=1381693 RepID=A0ABP0SBV6_9DINO